MADNFLGEIRIFAGNFAPTGWAMCNGQLLPISQNTALFSLIGTFYGGNGMTTFALPNLQGAAPLGVGQGPGLSDRELGDTGGEMAVTLLQSEMAAHSHAALADATSSAQTSPAGNTWGSLPGRTPPPRYATAPLDALMSPFALYTAGSSVPHNNMSPYLTLTFIIALQGLFPQRP